MLYTIMSFFKLAPSLIYNKQQPLTLSFHSFKILILTFHYYHCDRFNIFFYLQKLEKAFRTIKNKAIHPEFSFFSKMLLIRIAQFVGREIKDYVTESDHLEKGGRRNSTFSVQGSLSVLGSNI